MESTECKKKIPLKKKSDNDDQFVITEYYYVSGEPDDSGLSVYGSYSRTEAEEQLQKLAEEQLEDFKAMEKDGQEEMRKRAKDENLEITETETEINIKGSNWECTHTKSTFKIMEASRGTVVGDAKVEESMFHIGGCDGVGDFVLYDIEKLNKAK